MNALLDVLLLVLVWALVLAFTAWVSTRYLSGLLGAWTPYIVVVVAVIAVVHIVKRLIG